MESIVLWIHNGRGKLGKEALNLFKLMLYQYIKAMIYMSALFHLYSYFIVPYVRIPNPVISIVSFLYIWKIRSFCFYRSLPLALYIAMFDLCMTFFTGTVTVSTNWITYLIVLAFMILRLFVSKYNYLLIYCTA